LNAPFYKRTGAKFSKIALSGKNCYFCIYTKNALFYIKKGISKKKLKIFSKKVCGFKINTYL
jgi:hypothetical protein